MNNSEMLQRENMDIDSLSDQCVETWLILREQLEVEIAKRTNCLSFTEFLVSA